VSAARADYYEVLGIPRDAGEEAIRKAFHAAARDVHPDVSNAPDAEQRFRELAEAYSVLSEPGSRLLYDRFGYRGRGNRGFDEALWEARGPAHRGENVNAEVVLRAFEAEQGLSRNVTYEVAEACERCDGLGTEEAPDPGCPECGGSGTRREVSHSDAARVLSLAPCPACARGPCVECAGSGNVRVERTLKVRIPGGIDDGSQLRVGGEGDVPDDGAGPAGDLLIDVKVLSEPSDPRAVRYLALALFVAAVALLIAYVLFR
jgi:molecular chaperone DnaJ